jgi:hypothetical protein
MLTRKLLAVTFAALIVAGGGRPGDPTETGRGADPLSLLTEEVLHEHISVLASDEFEGRAPASRGEELTIDYLANQLRDAGVWPGNGDSFFQRVPLVAITG